MRDVTPQTRDMVGGDETYTARIVRWFDSHINQWVSTREAAEGAEVPVSAARSACRELVRKGFLIDNRSPAWRQRTPATHGRVLFRTTQGYMHSSRFRARRYPEAIFVGDDPIVGPFCQHCGNPVYMHGPKGECLNYRIHPLLPPGDLPQAS